MEKEGEEGKQDGEEGEVDKQRERWDVDKKVRLWKEGWVK